MTEIAHPIPVEFNNKELSDNKRRQYSIELANATLEIKKLRDQLAAKEEQATTDALTGLPNRYVFDEKLPSVFEIAKQKGDPLAVMMIDIDGLKMANEKLGHFKGDELIQAVSTAFEGILRDDDILGRFGGDEFYVILPNYAPTPGQSMYELNENFEDRFKQNIKDKFKLVIEGIGIPENFGAGISLGLATTEPSDSWESLAHRADEELIIDKTKSHENWNKLGIVFEDSRVRDV